MISPNLLAEIKTLQGHYAGVLGALLDESRTSVRSGTSLSTICAMSREAKDRFDALLQHSHTEAMTQQPTPEFRVAIIGSSNNGKTSVLAEMFPDVEERGLLITDVKDTTSQALMLKQGNESEMVFKPWTFDQIRYLVDISREDLARRKIEVHYREDHIEIDGDESDFETGVRSKFKFGLRQKLKPFIGNYVVDRAKQGDSGLVARLTTKKDYSQSTPPPPFNVNGESFNDLQFRAAVRSVDIGSSFSEIKRWMKQYGADPAFAGHLTFIDTPGLKPAEAGGIDSDEVLRQVLARKNQQIVVELLKNDELDLIVHLVLCGQQSDFSTLWNALEEKDSGVLQDLGDRIIVAVNGFNMYFNNVDLSRRWRNGASGTEDDHFNVSLQSCILGRLSERGTLNPLTICFLDVKRVAEGFSGGKSYTDFYRDCRGHAEAWAEPGGVGHDTLRRLGILDSFKKNLDAIANEEDCGKGFLVHCVMEAWKTQGPKLLVRRFIVRSGLLRSIRELRKFLSLYYDDQGKMTKQSVTDALKSTLAFLDPSSPDAIDTFCAREVDPYIAKKFVDLAIAEEKSPKWASIAFQKMVSWVVSRIKAHNPTMKPEVETNLKKFFHQELNSSAAAWGYMSSQLPLPSREDQAPHHLVVHALRYHAREFLHNCVQLAGSDDNLAGVMQDEKDREDMAAVMSSIKELQKEVEQFCATHGVSVT
jgi:hypothetical protein